jgi:hypothetical protein
MRMASTQVANSAASAAASSSWGPVVNSEETILLASQRPNRDEVLPIAGTIALTIKRSL